MIHAVSDAPGGTYERKSVTWEVFAHEPEVVPGPKGEFIMFFTADLRSPHGLCNCCRPGHGPCDGSTGPGDCPSDVAVEAGTPWTAKMAKKVGGGVEGGSDSYISYTSDPYGNWSAPKKMFPDYQGGDTNFAPVILSNGSVVAMWRHWGGGNGGSRMFLATAKDWKDPASYVQHQVELFPDLGAAGTEDQVRGERCRERGWGVVGWLGCARMCRCVCMYRGPCVCACGHMRDWNGTVADANTISLINTDRLLTLVYPHSSVTL